MQVWHFFSRRSAKYDYDETEAKWQQIINVPPQANGITVASLFYWAKCDSKSAYRVNCHALPTVSDCHAFHTVSWFSEEVPR